MKVFFTTDRNCPKSHPPPGFFHSSVPTTPRLCQLHPVGNGFSYERSHILERDPYRFVAATDVFWFEAHVAGVPCGFSVNGRSPKSSSNLLRWFGARWFGIQRGVP